MRKFIKRARRLIRDSIQNAKDDVAFDADMRRMYPNDPEVTSSPTTFLEALSWHLSDVFGCFFGLHETQFIRGGEDGPRGHQCTHCGMYTAKRERKAVA